jgi:hypothetical protein
MLGAVLLSAGLVLSLWALLVNNIALASNDYRSVILQAVVCSSLALVLLGISWVRLSWPGRVVAILFAVLNAVTLLDAAGRRLPSVFRW